MGLEDAKSEIDGAFLRPDLKGLAFENSFAGALSFLRRRYTRDLTGVDIAVTGIPFDQAVTNRPGARFGPRAIREQSSQQGYDTHWGWDGYSPLQSLAIADYGDVAFDFADTSDVPARIEAHVTGILTQGVACLALGGDHSVTLPVLRAHAARHGPLSLVQFDAHTDTWASADPGRIDHGAFAASAVAEGLIDPGQSIQIGIRTLVDDTMGLAQIDARAFEAKGADAAAAEVRSVVGDAPVYLSFDIDALDPAFAPGTGTPVWGGLTSREAAITLRSLAGINLVGADVVEVAPAYDPSGITAIAASHVALDLLCLWGWTRR
ncbi:MAG: agmatinase [Pseudomonadota bacterium]